MISPRAVLLCQALREVPLAVFVAGPHHLALTRHSVGVRILSSMYVRTSRRQEWGRAGRHNTDVGIIVPYADLGINTTSATPVTTSRRRLVPGSKT